MLSVLREGMGAVTDEWMMPNYFELELLVAIELPLFLGIASKRQLRGLDVRSMLQLKLRARLRFDGFIQLH